MTGTRVRNGNMIKDDSPKGSFASVVGMGLASLQDGDKSHGGVLPGLRSGLSRPERGSGAAIKPAAGSGTASRPVTCSGMASGSAAGSGWQTGLEEAS